MAFKWLRFPAEVKKQAIRTSTRPILNHPFIVGGFLFVILLYRSSPFLFSLLVSASPVLVCTAVLLGTLLSFGHPQFPEIDKDENVRREISSLRAVPLQNKFTVYHQESVDKDNDNGGQTSVIRLNQGGIHEDMLAVQVDDDQFESSSAGWTQMNGDDDEEDEYESSDSGSDGAESSSQEASMTDIIPLLQEIDPLIECEDSGLISNRSHDSNEGSINSDEETDHKDTAEEEDNQANNEDDVEKSAITWTEDDQKNVMDLGSSELERNQRLESLIARRRARRSMKERNLIDLDGFDLPNISTTRQNPFDFPNVTYDDLGLPPLPGSAPSILLPRRNPFDLPYDSSEEKPDLTGDSFQQEFMQLNIQKEAVFRRHESFHIGSSSSLASSRFRPYFVAAAPFMRQSSGISDLSSSSYQGQSSDMSDSKGSSVAEMEQVNAEEEIILNSDMDHVSVEHRNQSSDAVDDQYENRDFDVHMPEIRLGESEILVGADFSQAEKLAEEIQDRSSSSSSSSSEEEYNDVKDVDEGMVIKDEKLVETRKFETTEEDCNSSSNSSLVSEEHYNMESLKTDAANVNTRHNRPEVDDEGDVPLEQDIDVSSHTVDLDDVHFEEPVYDSSPRATKLNLSSTQAELFSLATELTEETELIDEDAVLSKEKLISVADETYSLEDKQAIADETYSLEDKQVNSQEINAEKIEEATKTGLQAVEPELSEIIEQKPFVENAEKCSLEVSLINTSVEITKSHKEELTDPHVLESEAEFHTLQVEANECIQQSKDKFLREEIEDGSMYGEPVAIHKDS